MPSGGARPGAGRPKLPEKYKAKITEAQEKVSEALPAVADALIDLALGIKVQDELGRVYTRPPDRAAGEYLWNRIAGKPTEQVNLDANVTPQPGIDLSKAPTELLEQLLQYTSVSAEDSESSEEEK